MTRNVRDQAAWLAGRLDGMDRKIAGLRSQGDLAFSSIEDGAIQEKDIDGNLVSSVGKQHDGSHVQVPFVGPVPPVPVAAQLVAGPGVLEVRWSGKFVDDAVSTMDFKHVSVHVSSTEGFVPGPDNQVATIRGEMGDLALLARDAGTYFVHLVAWSVAGKNSVASPAVMAVVPVPADADEIGERLAEIQTQADEATVAAAAADAAAGAASTAAGQAKTAAGAAQTAADQAAADALAAAGLAGSKGEIIYQLSAPTGTRANAANLWIRTTDNKPHTYNGTTWVAVTDKVAVDAAAKAAKAETDAANAKTAADAAKVRADAAFLEAQGAMQAAGQAQASANGKNNVYYRDVNPSGTGFVTGDTVFIRSEVGQPITAHRQWDGAVWKDVVLGHQIIASVDLGKATIGELDGVYIKAGTILAKSLAIGDFDNYASLVGTIDAWDYAGTQTTVTNQPYGLSVSGRSLRFQGSSGIGSIYGKRFTVEPGDKLFVSGMFRNDGGAAAVGRITLGLQYLNADGTVNGWDIYATFTDEVLTHATRKTITGVSTVPAGAAYARPLASTRAATGTADPTKFAFLLDPTIRRMASGSLIVDGAMDAKTITAPLMQTTNASNRGLKWKDDGLYAYNSVGTETFRLLASTGEASFLGRIRSGSEIEGATITGGFIQTDAGHRGVKIHPAGIVAIKDDGREIFSVNTLSGAVKLTGTISVLDDANKGGVLIEPTSPNAGWGESSKAVAKFVTGDTTETRPGAIYAYSDGDLPGKALAIHMWSPRRGNGSQASLQLISGHTGYSSAAYLTTAGGAMLGIHGNGQVGINSPAGIDITAPYVKINGRDLGPNTPNVNCAVRPGFTMQQGKPPVVRKDGNRTYLSWGIGGANFGPGAAKVFADLPPGFAPQTWKYFPVTGGSAMGFAMLIVKSTGELELRTSSTDSGYYIFDAVSWWTTEG